jgi:5-methyltetrahydropteroyltriglutamate--homocysteine methyltransferase
MIRTTHVGSLPRPDEVLEALAAREAGGPEPDPELIRRAVAECVERQVELGLDVVNDGETGKASYVTYVQERLTGFSPGRPPAGPRNNALDDFPEFAIRTWHPNRAQAVCSGEIRYRGAAAVEADIAALCQALEDHPGRYGFLTAASPGVVDLFHATTHYADRESYLLAIAEAMKTEYDAIHAAGLLLQLDCPDLAVQRTFFPPDAEGLAAFRRLAAQNVEVLNHALRDVPADRVRMHLCWGNYEGPHTFDIEVHKIAEVVLKAKPSTLLCEAANPRHGHDWAHWAAAKVPDDKIFCPGVIDSTTNFVEHPELVAERILRYADIVGRERVMAGTDCGFGTFAGWGGVVPEMVWEKLRSLVAGAAIATEKLW